MAINFRVYQDDQLIATTQNLTTVVPNISGDGIYTFKVTAYDGDKESDPATLVYSSINETRPYVLINRVANPGESVNVLYNEYNLGLVPLGTEPTGDFGGTTPETITGTVTLVKNTYSVVVFTDDRMADFRGQTFDDLTKPLFAKYKKISLP